MNIRTRWDATGRGCSVLGMLGVLGVLGSLVGCKSAEKKCAEDKDEKACTADCDEGKTTKSCTKLADMKLQLVKAPSVKKDVKGAYSLYKKACKKGDQYSCARTAYLMGRAGGPSYDNNEYKSITKDACDEDVQLGCALLANTNWWGTADEKEKAFKMAKKACDADVIEGCTLWASWSLEKGEKTEKAAKKLEELCDTGHEMPCFHWSMALNYGTKVDKDQAAAVKINKKFCDEDEAIFCSMLAKQHELGEGGLEKSAKKAYKFEKKACDLLNDSNHSYCKEAEKLKTAADAD